MPVKIQPTSVIKANLGIEPNGRAHKYLTERCYTYMDKYVPKDRGILRENATLETDKITYEQQYAHAQYTGIVNGGEVKNYTTPGTGSYWDERMKSAEMQDVIKEVQSFIDKGGK